MNARTQFLLDNPAIVYKVYSKYMYLVMDFEEFYQEILAKSLERMYAFDSSKASLCTYSTRFVQLVALQFFRQYLSELRSPVQVVSVGQLPESAVEPRNHVQTLENEDLCHRIVEMLDGRDRRIAEMVTDGLTAKEIAAHYGISRARVYQIFEKIRKKIRKAL